MSRRTRRSEFLGWLLWSLYSVLLMVGAVALGWFIVELARVR